MDLKGLDAQEQSVLLEEYMKSRFDRYVIIRSIDWQDAWVFVEYINPIFGALYPQQIGIEVADVINYLIEAN